jgi:PleD family two-component response regulator
MAEEQTSGLPISSMLKRSEVRVLVVEDDKFLREILVSKLRKESYTVIDAPGWEEAQLALKEQSPHVILLDLVLPGTDGFEILSLLKQDEKTSSIPVIIISNLGSKDDVDRAMGLGAKEFMIKAHHTPLEIVAAVKKVLDENYLTK